MDSNSAMLTDHRMAPRSVTATVVLMAERRAMGKDGMLAISKGMSLERPMVISMDSLRENPMEHRWATMMVIWRD